MILSVSLKKPPKVDLSKPELPRKLPEYTPVHLIDEEETIKSIPYPPSVPRVEIKEDSVPPVNDISIDISGFDLEARQYYFRKQRFFRILSVAVVVVAVAALIAFAIFLVNNVQIEQTSPSNVSTVSEVEQSSPADVSLALELTFLTVSDVLNWFLNSPVFLFVMFISSLLFCIRIVQNLMHR